MTDSPFVDCARAYMRDNAGFYSLRATYYPELAAAWTTGKAFFSGETTDGDLVTIKLAEVEAVMYCSIASQEATVDRQRAEEARNKPEGFE
jgi:hypothetical protein